ncbi:MAG TPA: hypothetical protein VGG87_05270, partial [Solirubrobacteraceae bacterium]
HRPECIALAFSLWFTSNSSDEECSDLPKQSQKPSPAREAPGPGRSTSGAAFNDLRNEVARRHELAHKEARKRRQAREREQILRRGDPDF